MLWICFCASVCLHRLFPLACSVVVLRFCTSFCTSFCASVIVFVRRTSFLCVFVHRSSFLCVGHRFCASVIVFVRRSSFLCVFVRRSSVLCVGHRFVRRSSSLSVFVRIVVYWAEGFKLCPSRPRSTCIVSNFCASFGASFFVTSIHFGHGEERSWCWQGWRTWR